MRKNHLAVLMLTVVLMLSGMAPMLAQDRGPAADLPPAASPPAVSPPDRGPQIAPTEVAPAPEIAPEIVLPDDVAAEADTEADDATLQAGTGGITVSTVGQLGGAVTAVDVQGNTAYLGDGSATLRIANISNPAAPTVVGVYTYTAPIVALCAEGGYLYVATANAVRVLNLSSPTSPAQVAVAQGFSAGVVRQIRVFGEWLYALSDGPTLTMFPLYDPGSLPWASDGQLSIPLLEDLDQVSRDYAYIVHEYHPDPLTYYVEVTPVPLHGGATPAPLSFADIGHAAVHTDPGGDLVLITTQTAGGCTPTTVSYVYDMSDVASPSLMRTINWETSRLCGAGVEVFISDYTVLSGGFGLLYGRLHDGGCGGGVSAPQLVLLDLRQPDGIRMVGRLPIATATQAQVVGDLIYEAHGDDGLVIRRVAWPTYVWQAEAEDPSFNQYGSLGQHWKASSCGYVTGVVEAPSGVPAAGEYFVWVRGMGVGGTENAANVRAAYACRQTLLEFAPVGGVPTWSWLRTPQPLPFRPTSDWLLIEPVISDTVRIDAFVVTDDANYVPSSIVPCLSSHPGFEAPAPWLNGLGAAAGGWTSQNTFPRLPGDVDGNGKADIVAFGNRTVSVSLSNGARLTAPATWLNGYGPEQGWTSFDVYPRWVADVTGDGKDDIVAFGDRAVYVSRSTGGGFTAPAAWLNAYGPLSGGWSSFDQFPRLLGDVDGDGKADIVAFGNRAVYVSLSTGSGFTAPAAWIAAYGPATGGWNSQNTFPRWVADVNADGKADILAFGNRAVYVSRSTGSGFTAPAPWINGYGPASGGWTSFELFPRWPADVNADGKTDIVAFGNKAAYVSLSSGAVFGQPIEAVRAYGPAAGGWSGYDLYPRLLGDLTGDGRADVVGFGARSVYVSSSIP